MNSSENKQKNQKGALYHPFTCYECDRWLVSCIFNTLPHLSPHAPEAPKMATLPMDLSLPVQSICMVECLLHTQQCTVCFFCPYPRSQIPSCCSLRSFLFGWFWGFFLGPHLWYMDVSGLGVKSELRLLVSTQATATQDSSCVCNLHCSLWQCQMPNPLSKAGD